MSDGSAPAETRLPLELPCTQAAFGALVGISQPAVSELMAKGVIAQGQPAGVWLLAYCGHIREMAAGRDPDGQLAEQRTRLAREQADRVAMQNAISRRDYMPVQLLEEVLAAVSRRAATQLDSLLPELLQRFPYLAGEPARFVQERLAAARDAMSSARFDAAQLESEPDDEDETPA